MSGDQAVQDAVAGLEGIGGSSTNSGAGGGVQRGGRYGSGVGAAADGEIGAIDADHRSVGVTRVGIRSTSHAGGGSGEVADGIGADAGGGAAAEKKRAAVNTDHIRLAATVCSGDTSVVDVAGGCGTRQLGTNAQLGQVCADIDIRG